MGPDLLLAVYLAPTGLVIFNMLRARSFSLHHFSSLRRHSKRITLEEWLAVYGYLGIGLTNRKQPQSTKPGRPRRLIGSAIALAASLILFEVNLPLNVPLSSAQHDWNAFPVIRVAIAGGVLASSVVLAFHRTRRWRLIGHYRAEYPYLPWDVLNKERGKKP